MSCAGRAGDGQGTGRDGTGRDSIDNLSLSLWLLAWLGSAFLRVVTFLTVRSVLKDILKSEI